MAKTKLTDEDFHLLLKTIYKELADSGRTFVLVGDHDGEVFYAHHGRAVTIFGLLTYAVKRAEHSFRKDFAENGDA